MIVGKSLKESIKTMAIKNPIETENPIFQKILTVLQSINNKMDSVETAATRDQSDYQEKIMDAFNDGCEHGANPPAELEIKYTAPALEEEVDEVLGNLADLPTCHAPPYQEPVSVIDPRTEQALRKEARERLDATQRMPVVAQVTKVTDHPSGRSRECQVPVKSGDRLVVDTDTLAVKVEEEKPQANSFVQWKRDADVWLGKSPNHNYRLDPPPNLGTLFACAQKMIAGLIRKEKKLRKDNDYLTEQLELATGLQDPAQFQPTIGDRFIIQYQHSFSTYVEIAVFINHLSVSHPCFETTNRTVEVDQVEAMMPFPESMDVERSE